MLEYIGTAVFNDEALWRVYSDGQLYKARPSLGNSTCKDGAVGSLAQCLSMFNLAEFKAA